LGLFVILLGSIAYLPTQAVNAGIAPPTFTIKDNDTGEDCEGDSIGHWNDITKTCRLTTDLAQGIVIGDDDITLDCKRHSIDGTSSGIGIEITGNNFVTIKNCTITDFGNGILLQANHDNTIIGNLLDGNGQGINLRGSFDNTIRDNTIINSGGSGIRIVDVGGNDDNIIINNIVNNNLARGIDLDNGERNHLEGNTFNQNGLDGILLRGSDHTLIGNTFNHNDLSGLFVDGILNDLIDNSANHNGEEGILLTGIADDNTLQGNTANHNGENGFIIAGEDNNLNDNQASHNELLGYDDNGVNSIFTDNKCVKNGSGGSDPADLCSPQS